MSKFEFVEGYVSDTFLSRDLENVFKVLSFSIKVNLDEDQSRGLTEKDIAKMFGDFMENLLLTQSRPKPYVEVDDKYKIVDQISIKEEEKYKITGMSNYRLVTEPVKNSFGWYKFNENQETPNG